MEENKKESKKVAILLMIVLFLLGIILGYASSKLLNKDEDKKDNDVEEKEEKKEEEREESKTDREKLLTISNRGEEQDINSSEIQKLYKNVTYGDGDNSIYEKESYLYPTEIFVVSEASDKEKISLIGHLLDKTNVREASCSDLKVSQIKVGNNVFLCEYPLSSEEKLYKSVEYYTKSYIEELYKSVFGSKATINTDYPISANPYSTVIYSYIESLGNYYMYVVDGGGTTGMPYNVTYTLKRAYKTEEYLVLEREIKYTDDNQKLVVEPTIVKYVFVKDENSYRFFGKY